MLSRVQNITHRFCRCAAVNTVREYDRIIINGDKYLTKDARSVAWLWDIHMKRTNLRREQGGVRSPANGASTADNK